MCMSDMIIIVNVKIFNSSRSSLVFPAANLRVCAIPDRIGLTV